MHPIHFIRIPGHVEYPAMLERQLETRNAVAAGTAPPTVFLLEHAPTITLGRRARREHILADAQTLERSGVSVVSTDRGGDVTWHGPGQMVAYPILNLNQWHPSIDWYLRALEETLILTLVSWGLHGERLPGFTGLWVKGAKIAAIGVAVRQWITWHGVALNVCPSREHWRMIVPCGIKDKPVTSLDALLPHPPSMSEVMTCFECAFTQVFALDAAFPDLPNTREQAKMRQQSSG